MLQKKAEKRTIKIGHKFLITEQNINKLYFYAKDPFEGKCQLLINKQVITCLNHFNNPKTFI